MIPFGSGDPMSELLIQDDDAVRVLTMNRPEKRNALNLTLSEALFDALREADRAESVRAMVLTGAGPAFCAGADLVEFAGLESARLALVERRANITAKLHGVFSQLTKPVVTAINGAAMGGGCEIALACDIRIISDTATIGLPEIRFGALPAGGGTQRLPRLVGAGVAKEMIFSGLPWTAEDAFRVGLVNRVAPASELIEKCEKIARVYIERAAYALKTAKQLVNRGVELTLKDGIALERKMIAEMATPAERKEAQDRAAATQKTYARIFEKRS